MQEQPWYLHCSIKSQTHNILFESPEVSDKCILSLDTPVHSIFYCVGKEKRTIQCHVAKKKKRNITVTVAHSELVDAKAVFKKQCRMKETHTKTTSAASIHHSQNTNFLHIYTTEVFHSVLHANIPLKDS